MSDTATALTDEESLKRRRDEEKRAYNDRKKKAADDEKKKKKAWIVRLGSEQQQKKEEGFKSWRQQMKDDRKAAKVMEKKQQNMKNKAHNQQSQFLAKKTAVKESWAVTDADLELASKKTAIKESWAVTDADLELASTRERKNKLKDADMEPEGKRERKQKRDKVPPDTEGDPEASPLEPKDDSRKKEKKHKPNPAPEAENDDPEAYKVCLAGLPTHITEDLLRRDFAECGTVLACRLLRDRDTRTSRGIAFISFTSLDALEEALKFNGKDYGGRDLLVQKAHGGGSKTAGSKGDVTGPGSKPEGCTSVVVKGLAYTVTDVDLERTFKSCGTGPSNVNILLDRETGRSRGMAFVDFDDEAAVDEAMKLTGTELNGRRFQMDYATPRAKAVVAPGDKPAGCTSIVVKGLAYSVTDADLMKTFRDCGFGPTSIRIAINKETGMSRGIAFLDFEDADGLDEAVKLNGTELKGRSFIVDYAAAFDKDQAQEKKSKGPGKRPEGCTSVMLSGLAAAVTEKKVMKLFKDCAGGPRSVNIVMDKKTGEPNGTAFVNFKKTTAVDEAMKLNGTELKGQCFTMVYVKPKPKKDVE